MIPIMVLIWAMIHIKNELIDSLLKTNKPVKFDNGLVLPNIISNSQVLLVSSEALIFVLVKGIMSHKYNNLTFGMALNFTTLMDS
ncbi:hypothetical protein D3C86_1226140 [compost metagenome]